MTIFCTNVLASVLPSLPLVWPSNCGSASLTDTIAVRPSRMSSPDRFGCFSLRIPQSRANLFIIVVSAARNPSSWVPPPTVLMVLANVYTDSLKPWFHCSATSAAMRLSSVSSSKWMTVGFAGPLLALRWVTKSAMPPA